MIKLSKSFTFEAAHKLPFHQGKCARLHGHSWKLIVEIIGNETSLTDGILIDYGLIKSIVNPIVEKHLDHYYLNKTLELESPTSENVAIWLWTVLKPKFSVFDNIKLNKITIKETCTSKCTYKGK